jgi:hypothetical protein
MRICSGSSVLLAGQRIELGDLSISSPKKLMRQARSS